MTEILSRKNMRLINLGAIGVITVAWLVRFYYFSKREEVKEIEKEYPNTNGVGTYKATVLEKVEVQDNFWMILYTLFVFPTLIVIFVVQELQVTQERLAPICKHFYFLDYYTGKGLYILLMTSLILQHSTVFQWLVAVALFAVVLVNLVYPCLFGADPINGEGVMVVQVQTDKSIKIDLEKAEALAAKNRVVKPKDPENTAKAQEELEQEGKSIVEAKNTKMNDDKLSG